MRHLESRFKVRVIRHPLAETVSDQDDALILCRSFRFCCNEGEG
jgi:hypothetical protein